MELLQIIYVKYIPDFVPGGVHESRRVAIYSAGEWDGVFAPRSGWRRVREEA